MVISCVCCVPRARLRLSLLLRGVTYAWSKVVYCTHQPRHIKGTCHAADTVSFPIFLCESATMCALVHTRLSRQHKLEVMLILASDASLYVGCTYMQGRFCVIRDGAQILDGAVLAPQTVVPSHCIYGGSPGKHVRLTAARRVGTLPESFTSSQELDSRTYFHAFRPPR